MSPEFRKLLTISQPTQEIRLTGAYGPVRGRFITHLAAAGVFLSASPAYAAEECGAPAGLPPTVTCSDTSLNPYSGGIIYTPPNGLDLNVLSGLQIEPATGFNANGIRVSGGGVDPLRVFVANGVSILTGGDESDGVEVHSTDDSDVVIVSGADITVGTPGSPAVNSRALLGRISDPASVGNISITQTASGTHRVTGDTSYSIYGISEGLGSIYIEAAGDNFTTGSSSYGINALINNALGGNIEINLTSTGRVFTDGQNSTALYALNYGSGSTTISLSGLVETKQLFSDGALAYIPNVSSSADATITISSSGVIRALGDRTYGAWALNDGTGEARITNSGRVLASGSESIGLVALGAADAVVTTAGNVTAGGEYGIGIFARSATTTATVNIAAGASVMGGWQSDGGSVSPNSGRPAAGVILRSPNSTLNNAGSVGAGSDRAVADEGRWNVRLGPLSVINSGTITGFVQFADVAGNNFANAAGGLFDFRHFADTDGDGTRDTKRVAIADFGNPTNSLFANAAGATLRLAPVQGNVATDASGYYVPTAGAASTPLDASIYDLSHSGIVQGQFINLGAFDNAGTIDLRGPATGNSLIITGNAIADGTPGGGVFTSNGGSLLVNAFVGDTGTAHADVLTVDSTALGTGPTRIVVDRREGPGEVTSGNGILVVEVRDKAASDPGAFALQGDYAVNGEQVIIGGLYTYGLFHNGVDADAADGNWYLRSVGFSPTAPVYQEYPKVLLPLAELPTLQQRVGNRHWRALTGPADVPAKQAAADDDLVVVEENGMWARIEGSYGHYETASSTVDADFNARIWRLQAGFDGLVLDSADGRLLAGLSVHYGHVRGKIDSSYGGGTVSAHGYGFGGSLTWYGLTGFYADAQMQATLFNSDIKSSTTGATLIDGNDGFGYALGLEIGRKFALGPKWSVIPQAQLIYTRIEFDDFTDTYSTHVALRSGDSLRARAGAAGEYENRWKAADGTGSRSTLYAIANLYNEFLDGFVVSISGAELDSRNESLWGGLGLGGTYSWGDDRYAVYAEALVRTGLESFGDSYTVAGTVGMRVRL
jgi:outer membrane autotransporter protein